MSGAGRKVFQPGEVLTASNVQNYLQDQAVQYYAGTAARGSAIGTATTEGMMSYLADTNSVQMATGTATWVNVDGVPIVAGTAARNALYPSPVPGNIVFRSDSLQLETYYAATGSPSRAAGWYSGQDGGLVPIIPTSITVGSGSASVTGNGLITISAASNIAINGAFTSSYRNYRLIFENFTNSTTSQNRLQYRASGANTATNYETVGFYQLGTGALSMQVYAAAGATYAAMFEGNTSSSFAIYDISCPNIAADTRHLGEAVCYSGASSMRLSVGGKQASSTVFDGFTVSAATGTFSGSLKIYGYRD